MLLLAQVLSPSTIWTIATLEQILLGDQVPCCVLDELTSASAYLALGKDNLGLTSSHLRLEEGRAI